MRESLATPSARLRETLGPALPSSVPSEQENTRITFKPVQVGRAHSLHRAPWLPCAMGPLLADGIRMPHAGPKE